MKVKARAALSANRLVIPRDGQSLKKKDVSLSSVYYLFVTLCHIRSHYPKESSAPWLLLSY